MPIWALPINPMANTSVALCPWLTACVFSSEVTRWGQSLCGPGWQVQLSRALLGSALPQAHEKLFIFVLPIMFLMALPIRQWLCAWVAGTRHGHPLGTEPLAYKLTPSHQGSAPFCSIVHEKLRKVKQEVKDVFFLDGFLPIQQPWALS